MERDGGDGGDFVWCVFQSIEGFLLHFAGALPAEGKGGVLTARATASSQLCFGLFLNILEGRPARFPAQQHTPSHYPSLPFGIKRKKKDT